jgi:hypothetical protein
MKLPPAASGGPQGSQHRVGQLASLELVVSFRRRETAMGKKGMGDHAIRGVEDEHGALRIPFVDQVRKLADRHGGEDEAAEDAVLAHGGQGGEEAHPQLANIEYGKPDDTLGFHRRRDQVVRIGLLGQTARYAIDAVGAARTPQHDDRG